MQLARTLALGLLTELMGLEELCDILDRNSVSMPLKHGDRSNLAWCILENYFLHVQQRELPFWPLSSALQVASAMTTGKVACIQNRIPRHTLLWYHVHGLPQAFGGDNAGPRKTELIRQTEQRVQDTPAKWKPDIDSFVEKVQSARPLQAAGGL